MISIQCARKRSKAKGKSNLLAAPIDNDNDNNRNNNQMVHASPAAKNNKNKTNIKNNNKHRKAGKTKYNELIEISSDDDTKESGKKKRRISKKAYRDHDGILNMDVLKHDLKEFIIFMQKYIYEANGNLIVMDCNNSNNNNNDGDSTGEIFHKYAYIIDQGMSLLNAYEFINRRKAELWSNKLDVEQKCESLTRKHQNLMQAQREELRKQEIQLTRLRADITKKKRTIKSHETSFEEKLNQQKQSLQNIAIEHSSFQRFDEDYVTLFSRVDVVEPLQSNDNKSKENTESNN